MTRATSRRGDERGSVLVIAIILIALMLTLGTASIAFVDGQTQRAAEQRARETALNLAEGVLYNQGFVLAKAWPGNALSGGAVPALCTSATVQTLCPDPNTLAAANSSMPAAANFANGDAGAQASWWTRIRDNGGPLADAYASESADAPQSGINAAYGTAYTCPGPCKWDANGDLKLWVQSQAIVRGRPRNIVGLLRREQFSENFARNGVTAGSVRVTNSGNKTIIDATGSQVVVRCATTRRRARTTTRPRARSCRPRSSATRRRSRDDRGAGGPLQGRRDQREPADVSHVVPGGLGGTIVVIDVPAATTCTDANSAVYNTATRPGIVIMPRGSFSLKGTYYGLIYMRNEQNSSGPVLTLEANSLVTGSVAIDGAGGLVSGQSNTTLPTVKYDPRGSTGSRRTARRASCRTPGASCVRPDAASSVPCYAGGDGAAGVPPPA